MNYNINKKGEIKYQSHYMGIFREGYMCFNQEMEYSIEDLENILKLIKKRCEK